MRFQPSGRCVVVAAGSTLLAAARRAGLPLAAACGGDALCGRCGVTLLSGAGAVSPEDAAEAKAKVRNRVAQGSVSPAAPRLLGDLEVTASYW